MSNRGVLYVCWGQGVERELQASIRSVQENTCLPYHVVRLTDAKHHAAKTAMYEASPFDVTLFLDTDTVALADLSLGFRLAERFDIAVSLAPACFADRWPINDEETIEYNTGVLFFRKCKKNRAFFAAWGQNAEAFPYSDQASFAKTVVECGISPAALPPNFNYRGSMAARPVFGQIKVWHSREEIPINIREWNSQTEYKFGEIVQDRDKPVIVPHGVIPVHIRADLMACLRRIVHLLAAAFRAGLSRFRRAN